MAPTPRADGPLSHALPLGRLGGVPLRAHWSFPLLVVLLAALVSSSILPALEPGHSAVAYWAVGVLASVLFVVALTAHEFAHAVVARHYGVEVKRMTLWLLGGLTELGGEPPTPRAEAWVAAAGPLTTLAAAAAFLGAGALLGGSLLGATMAWLAAANIAIAVFNLLPGAPLDGGRLLRAALWKRSGDRTRAAVSAAHVGRLLGFVLAVLGGLELLAGYVSGLWLMAIGWFIASAATAERAAPDVRALAGLTVADAMRPAPPSCMSWWTVGQFAAWLAQQHPAQQLVQPIYPLVDIDGRAAGALTARDLEQAGRQRADARAGEVAGRRAPCPLVAPDLPLPDLFGRLRGGWHFAVVVDGGGRPIGIVSEAEVGRIARLAALHRPAPEPVPPSTLPPPPVPPAPMPPAGWPPRRP